MITLTIDNQKIQVPAGTTVLRAARDLGLTIPTLCYQDGFKPFTSCMVCVVEIDGYPSLMPSCGLPVDEGMVVRTGTEKVLQARRAALELLLSDHIGDCEGPCRFGCPAGMDIPQMIRHIAAGNLHKAVRIVKRDIALPGVLGRICPAPCDKVCRRSVQDSAVSICLLKRYVADIDMKLPVPYRPDCLSSTGKKVAVIGGGPCGLAATYHLTQRGHQCVVFDKNECPGGMLRSGSLREKLPLEVLDREIGLIFDLGGKFQGSRELGRDFSLEELREEFDAVFLAFGEAANRPPISLPLEMREDKIHTLGNTYQTSINGVFAGGGAIGSRRLCVRAVADGKEAAAAIDQFLCGLAVKGIEREFNSRLGELTEEEWAKFASEAEPRDRIEPDDTKTGFSAKEAEIEARRCLHCDCRKKKNCALRRLSTELKALSGTYKGGRRPYARLGGHPEVFFEPGKCIQCGLCIQVLKRSGALQGLTFRGRGFQVQLAAALDQSIDQVVGKTARQCVEVCPTGAWALKHETE